MYTAVLVITSVLPLGLVHGIVRQKNSDQQTDLADVAPWGAVGNVSKAAQQCPLVLNVGQ